MLGVRVRLCDVLALHVEGAEGAVDGGVEHVGDSQTWLFEQRRSPEVLEDVTHGVVGDVTVTGKLVGEGAHVARALHVVLSAQRVDAHAVVADVAGGHREVGHAHHHR